MFDFSRSGSPRSGSLLSLSVCQVELMTLKLSSYVDPRFDCGSQQELFRIPLLKNWTPKELSLAMVKELKGLTHVKAGRIMKEKEALQFCKKHNIKGISCRWVTNSKPEADEGVVLG